MPIKVLFTMEIPVSASKVVEILNPSNVDYQKKWNQAFPEHEVVKTYPEQEGGAAYFIQDSKFLKSSKQAFPEHEVVNTYSEQEGGGSIFYARLKVS